MGCVGGEDDEELLLCRLPQHPTLPHLPAYRYLHDCVSRYLSTWGKKSSLPALLRLARVAWALFFFPFPNSNSTPTSYFP